MVRGPVAAIDTAASCDMPMDLRVSCRPSGVPGQLDDDRPAGMSSSNCPGTPLGRHETRRSIGMSQDAAVSMAATGPRTMPEPLYGGTGTGRRVTVRDIAAA